MKRVVFFLLGLSSLLFSASLVSWQDVPKKIFLNQIFPVTIRVLATDPNALPIFSFKKGEGVELRYGGDPISKDDLYFYKTFYFKATSLNASLPQVTVEMGGAILHLSPYHLNVKALKIPTDYCGVIGKRLTILKHQEVQYNKKLNLIILQLKSQLANLEDFSLPYAQKEELKEFNESFPIATTFYYAIIPSSMDKVRFSYFDTDAREFKKLFFDVKVLDETVSTQSDINPTEDKHKNIKIGLSLVWGLIALFFAFWRNSIFSGIIGVLFLSYAIYISIPLQKVCVKKGSKIYILPTRNSTIFKINPAKGEYLKLNEVNGYVKIKLSKQKVGWVKDEDLCQN
ncbi:MAG: hypothetical protein GXO61_04005 [Epsilonproteobacteria bacterium]|nr:hypothetical protein [Campylobacterota bacterium]